MTRWLGNNIFIGSWLVTSGASQYQKWHSNPIAGCYYSVGILCPSYATCAVSATFYSLNICIYQSRWWWFRQNFSATFIYNERKKILPQFHVQIKPTIRCSVILSDSQHQHESTQYLITKPTDLRPHLVIRNSYKTVIWQASARDASLWTTLVGRPSMSPV